jgi:hypothetical protein
LRKWLPVTNTLAYYGTELTEAVKSILMQLPRVKKN